MCQEDTLSVDGLSREIIFFTSFSLYGRTVLFTLLVVEYLFFSFSLSIPFGIYLL